MALKSTGTTSRRKKATSPPVGEDRIPKPSQGYYTDPEDGTKLRRVTTILGQGYPKPELVFWSANLTAADAFDNLPTLVRASMNPEDKEQAYDWLRKGHIRKKEDRGELGTAAHKLVESHVLGTPLPEELLTDEEMAPYLENFLRFIDEWQVEFEASEMVVANYANRYAGKLDYLLRSPRIAAQLEVPADTVFIGDTKGLALDTPLPTPTGWTTMGAVQVGDALLGSDGKPCSVTETSEIHYRDCYRVTFDDGSSVVCDDEHLWMTDSGSQKIRRQVASTVELRATLRQYGQRQHRVPVVTPLELPDTPLPIDPYVLGCWLGDGKHTSGEISSQDKQLFDNIVDCGYAVGPEQKKARPGSCPVRTVLGLAADLRSTGVLGNKHIPDAYLRASREQRLALLQGLMDTDGTWNRRRNSAQFVSSSKAFASSVRELALSLGQRVAMFEMSHTGFKAGAHYLVTFTPRDLAPFRLTRKAELVSVPSTVRAARRVITSIDPTVTVPTKCIAVDSADRTYLCTDSMIPTHNTGGELDEKGVYPEAGLQMAAYRKAEVAWLRDGSKVPLPPIHDTGIVLHLRPEGYRVIPLNCGDDVFAAFLHVQQVAEFKRVLCKSVVGEALTLPAPVTEGVAA